MELKFNERFREKGIHVFCKRVAKRERERERRGGCKRSEREEGEINTEKRERRQT